MTSFPFWGAVCLSLLAIMIKFPLNYCSSLTCTSDTCGDEVSSGDQTCYCDFNCVTNGDCCDQVCSSCGYGCNSTSTNFPTVIGNETCENNCGSSLICTDRDSCCACDSMCTFAGDCCSDYLTFCSNSTTTPTSVSFVQPSCNGSCGLAVCDSDDDEDCCYCDHSCILNGDCCNDYTTHCANVTLSPTFSPTERFPTTSPTLLSPTLAPTSSPNPTSYPTPTPTLTCTIDTCDDEVIFGEETCHCDANCIVNGDCCDEVCSSCGYGCNTTTTIAPTLSGNATCENNCGISQVCGDTLSCCACDSMCRYAGDCCSDYSDFCTNSTTTPTSVPFQSSCNGSCGLLVCDSSEDDCCYCDATCLLNGDCCDDYTAVCANSTSLPTTFSTFVPTTHLPTFYPTDGYPTSEVTTKLSTITPTTTRQQSEALMFSPTSYSTTSRFLTAYPTLQATMSPTTTSAEKEYFYQVEFQILLTGLDEEAFDEFQEDFISVTAALLGVEERQISIIVTIYSSATTTPTSLGDGARDLSTIGIYIDVVVTQISESSVATQLAEDLSTAIEDGTYLETLQDEGIEIASLAETQAPTIVTVLAATSLPSSGIPTTTPTVFTSTTTTKARAWVMMIGAGIAFLLFGGAVGGLAYWYCKQRGPKQRIGVGAPSERRSVSRRGHLQHPGPSVSQPASSRYASSPPSKKQTSIQRLTSRFTTPKYGAREDEDLNALSVEAEEGYVNADLVETPPSSKSPHSQELRRVSDPPRELELQDKDVGQLL